MNYPMVLICGTSGTGKSYSLRNLPKDRTFIFNLEQKILPFKEALQFKNCCDTDNIIEFENKLNIVLASPDIDIVVLESFSRYSDLLLDHSKKFNKGYEIYNFLNDKLFNTFKRTKNNGGKFVIYIAVDERVDDIRLDGSIQTVRRAKVDGKKFEGKVEAEFTVVLYTDVLISKDKSNEYRFLTNTDGIRAAKSPPGLFDNKPYIPNDVNAVINRMREYYELSSVPTTESMPVKTQLQPLATYK